MTRTEDVLIAMRDGVRLAATLYLPDDEGPDDEGRPLGTRRWPSLLEALPYRKDDLTAHYRADYRRFADEFGYAVCRVDIRGTGSSEGVATGEYTADELRDLAEVVGWLAGQPWSNGNVGMFGTSWSGFNSLQVAMLRPPRPEGDLLDLRLRRPVCGRRPLLRGCAEAARPGGLADLHGRDQRPPARSPRRRRGLAGRMGASRRHVRAVVVRLARAPDVRRLLEARIAAGGLRRDRGRDDAGHRLGRRLHEHRAARHGRSHVSEAPPRRPVVARRGRDLAPRTEHRPRRRDGEVVGSLAERCRQRRGPGSVDRGLHPPAHAARSRSRRVSGRVEVRGRVATRSRTRARARARRGAREPAGRGAGPSRRSRRRGVDGVAVLRWAAAVGPAARPTSGRGVLARVRLGSRAGGAGDPRPSGRPRMRGGLRAGRVPVGQALRRASGRHLAARHPWTAQPHASGLTGSTLGARTRTDLRGVVRARSDVVGVRTRPPHPPRSRGHRLAELLAAARPRHADDRARWFVDRAPRRRRAVADRRTAEAARSATTSDVEHGRRDVVDRAGRRSQADASRRGLCHAERRGRGGTVDRGTHRRRGRRRDRRSGTLVGRRELELRAVLARDDRFDRRFPRSLQ